MGEAFTRSDPSGFIAKMLVGNGTGTALPVRIEKRAASFVGTANGSLVQWQNPLDVEVLVTALVHVTTAGTGTAGFDIGVGTLAGSSDNLIDAGRVDTVQTVRGMGSADMGTNGRMWRRMTAKGGTLDYITGKMTEVDATAAANVYIIYIPVS